MRRVLAACGGFLFAVLWFDLMFDVQVLSHPSSAVLPESVLASIAAYYRRVTTDAFPMNRLIAVVMLVAIGGAAWQLLRLGPVPPPLRVRGRSIRRRWPGGLAAAGLLLALLPIGLAFMRVFPNAVRLGARTDSIEVQSALARAICHDHLFCAAAIFLFVVVQVLDTEISDTEISEARRRHPARGHGGSEVGDT